MDACACEDANERVAHLYKYVSFKKHFCAKRTENTYLMEPDREQPINISQQKVE